MLPTYNETGWNQLHLTANPSLPLQEQYRAVGFLEGYLTQADIFDHFHNFVEGQLGQTNVPANLSRYLEEQVAFLKVMAQENEGDLYWGLAGALLGQLEGMHHGYMARVNADRRYSQAISRFHYFMYLTNMGDINDLLPAFKPGALK